MNKSTCICNYCAKELDTQAAERKINKNNTDMEADNALAVGSNKWCKKQQCEYNLAYTDS